MLMNDQRECAQQINKLMAQKPILSYEVAGTVEAFQGAYLFGHYDSRGGATMVVEARSGVEACIDYNRGCGFDDLANSALEDILTPQGCEIYFVGRKPDRLQDLQYGFEDAESGYLYARVQTRWCNNRGGSWSSWEDEPAWVFFPVPPGWELDSPTSNADRWGACQDGDFKGLTKVRPYMPKIEFSRPILLQRQIRLRPDDLSEDACGVIFMRCEPLVEVNLGLGT